MNVKRHKVSSTEIQYDNLYREKDQDISAGFKSTRGKRHTFKTQDKAQFQDEEDIADELSHLKLIGDMKDVTGTFELNLKEVGERIKPEKKSKVKLRLFDEEDEVDERMHLKKVEPKLKFIRNTKISDAVFKNYHKVEYLPSITRVVLPENYTSSYKLQDNLQTQAQNSLTSKFTNTTSSTTHLPNPPSPRKVIKEISIDPVILKRLGL